VLKASRSNVKRPTISVLSKMFCVKRSKLFTTKRIGLVPPTPLKTQNGCTDFTVQPLSERLTSNQGAFTWGVTTR
jgi:hypothetical protein